MKNKVLISINYIAAFIFIVAVCAMDSDSWLPYIACAVCEVWFVLMLIANRERLCRW